MNHPSFRFASFTATLIVAACAPSEPPVATTERVITTALLDSLPHATLVDGGRVCYAEGRDSCPLYPAVATWLTPDRFALWGDPFGQIAAYHLGDTVGVLIGAPGNGVGKYTLPGGVGSAKNGDILVLDATGNAVLRYDDEGKFLRTQPLPKLFGLTAWGFSGKVAFLERFVSKDSVSQANLEIRILKEAGDSAGRVALQRPLPWLYLNNNEVSAPLPLIPTQPIFAVAEDGALIWSSAEKLWLQRVNPAGGTDWTVTSDIAGPAITREAIDLRRKLLEAQGAPAADLDSMAARTPATYPAVTSILLNREGRIVVGQAVVPSADSVTYLLLAKDGAPLTQFTLKSSVHPLLFSGDSLLVSRLVGSEPREVRWIQVKFGR